MTIYICEPVCPRPGSPVTSNSVGACLLVIRVKKVDDILAHTCEDVLCSYCPGDPSIFLPLKERLHKAQGWPNMLSLSLCATFTRVLLPSFSVPAWRRLCQSPRAAFWGAPCSQPPSSAASSTGPCLPRAARSPPSSSSGTCTASSSRSMYAPHNAAAAAARKQHRPTRCRAGVRFYWICALHLCSLVSGGARIGCEYNLPDRLLLDISSCACCCIFQHSHRGQGSAELKHAQLVPQTMPLCCCRILAHLVRANPEHDGGIGAS